MSQEPPPVHPSLLAMGSARRLALGLWHRRGPFGGIGRAERRALAEALAAVGLTGFDRRTIGSLSGGQLSGRSSPGFCSRMRR